MLIDLRRVKVTDRERGSITDVLSNWDNVHGKLTQAAKSGEISADHVLRMLKVEVTTRKRMLLCTRLLAVYHTLAKRENERRVALALSR